MEANTNNKEEAQEVSVKKTKPKPTKVMKNVLTPINIISFIISLPLLAVAIWLLFMRDYDCEYLLRMPKLRIGIAISMIVVFVVSNVVVFFGSRVLIPGLVVVMVPLIMMLTTGLAFVGAYKIESRAVPASPMWFRLRVYNDHNWDNIKSCIYNVKICEDLAYRTLMLTSYDFSLKKVSLIESGCCKPPTYCEMVYVNATHWKKNEDVTADRFSKFGDCGNWNNKQNQLCYNCETCKEGFLSTIRRQWQNLGIFLIVMAILLIIAHFTVFLTTVMSRNKT